MSASALLTVPDDIFRALLLHLDGYALCSLWVSGDLGLQKRLSRPQMVISFHLVYRPKSEKSWPNIVKVFPHLKQLVVSTSFLERETIVFGIDFSTVTPQLEHLHLEFSNATFELVDWVHNLSLAPETRKENMRAKDLSKIWPNLLTLTVLGDVIQLPAIQNFAACLPRTLISFHTGYPKIYTTEDVASLPPLMRQIEMRASSDSEWRNAVLPPLEYLSLRSGYTNAFELPMPASLTHLHLHHDSDGALRLDTLKSLPSLTNLQILRLNSVRCFTTQIASLLPPSITDLSVWATSQPSDWKQVFNLLPRHLTSLTLHFPRMRGITYRVGDRTNREVVLDESAIRALPPRIQVLSKTIIINPALWHLLPSTLTEFNTEHCIVYKLDALDTFKMPSGLKTLVSKGKSDRHGDAPLSDPIIPSHWTEHFFPVTLTKLKISSNIPSAWLKTFRSLRSLETLELCFTSSIVGSDFNELNTISPFFITLQMAGLPIQELDLGAKWLSRAVSLGLQNLSGKCGPKEYLALPRSLSELGLSGEKLECVADFTNLPRQLAVLLFSNPSNWCESSLDGIPSSVQSIRIKGNFLDPSNTEGLFSKLFSKGPGIIGFDDLRESSLRSSFFTISRLTPEDVLKANRLLPPYFHFDFSNVFDRWHEAYLSNFLEPEKLTQYLAVRDTSPSGIATSFILKRPDTFPTYLMKAALEHT